MAFSLFDRVQPTAPKKAGRFNRFAKIKRRVPGERNKTEAAYEAHLTTLKAAGEILDFRFEGVKLRLADNTFFTPDFLVFDADGTVELHDTKGTTKKANSKGEKVAKPWCEDDAKLKLKLVAELYPFRVFIAWKHEGTWHKDEI